jgi:deoxyadenosine/deoxycytidine kinase
VSVQDRTIYEHFHVFVTSHFEQGILEEEQFRSLEDHFRSLTRVVPGPDLMIYLRAGIPTLVERIRGRDRSIEANVQVEVIELYTESLTGPDEGAPDYLTMMRVNTERITTGLTS